MRRKFSMLVMAAIVALTMAFAGPAMAAGKSGTDCNCQKSICKVQSSKGNCQKSICKVQSSKGNLKLSAGKVSLVIKT